MSFVSLSLGPVAACESSASPPSAANPPHDEKGFNAASDFTAVAASFARALVAQDDVLVESLLFVTDSEDPEWIPRRIDLAASVCLSSCSDFLLSLPNPSPRRPPRASLSSFLPELSGGVVPEENLDDILEIHEPRLPLFVATGLGELVANVLELADLAEGLFECVDNKGEARAGGQGLGAGDGESVWVEGILLLSLLS